MLDLTKRQKIIVASILLTIGLLSTQLVNYNLRLIFIAGLGVLAYLLSLWALWEGINNFKALVLMILPTFFTLAVATFYFLLPIRWLTRLPILVIYGFSFYLLLLSQNVFNVASIRTIQLYRAASIVSFVITIFTALVIYTVIYTLRLPFYFNAIALFLVSFPLVLQNLWSVEMDDKVSTATIFQSFIISLILGELALAFSFWPLLPLTWSIVLATSLYVLLGITTEDLKKRLRREDLRIYLMVGGVILTLAFFLTSWTG